MKFPSAFLILVLFSGSAACAQTASTQTHRAHAKVPTTTVHKAPPLQSQNKPSNSITIRPRINRSGSGKEHVSNSFNDISQSMPTAAVKEELARKHELPGQQSSVLTPGDTASITGSGATTVNEGTTGAAPRIETGSGMALPQPTGGTSGVFK